MDYISTNSGVNSSSHFLFQCGETDRLTDATDHPTHATATAGVR